MTKYCTYLWVLTKPLKFQNVSSVINRLLLLLDQTLITILQPGVIFASERLYHSPECTLIITGMAKVFLNLLVLQSTSFRYYMAVSKG